MLSFHVKFVQTDRRMDGQMDRQTYGQTMVKQYAPASKDRGIKKMNIKYNWLVGSFTQHQNFTC